MLECVANVSEGRDANLLDDLRGVCDGDLLDLHVDSDHHRSVFTLVGVESVRRLTRRASEVLDLALHVGGVHPRLGVVDVVPFVPLLDSDMDDALRARQVFAEWAADTLGIPSFLYGPAHGSLGSDRALPDIRRNAWSSLRPDVGPDIPHPSAGAICVGARPVLVAYNIWMSDSSDGSAVHTIATAMRSARVRALALRVGSSFQVSMNLVDPLTTGPDHVHRRVMELSAGTQARVQRCELVGLVPRAVLDRIPESEWARLDLSPERTIEARLRATGRQ